jgi:hypothetical protein
MKNAPLHEATPAARPHSSQITPFAGRVLQITSGNPMTAEQIRTTLGADEGHQTPSVYSVSRAVERLQRLEWLT